MFDFFQIMLLHIYKNFKLYRICSRMLIEDHSEKLFEGNRVRLTHFPLYHYLFEAQTHFLMKGQEKPDLSHRAYF